MGSYIAVKDCKPFSGRISGILYTVSGGLLEANVDTRKFAMEALYIKCKMETKINSICK